MKDDATPFLRRRETGTTDRAALTHVAALVTLTFMCSTLVTPLYEIYRDEFDFSEITLTLVYAVYVVGNLAALLFLGRLSDQVGRRRVALAAMALAAASALLFLFAGATAWLFAARMLSGLAIGLAAGTATAWLAELQSGTDKSQASLLAAAANLTGLALGPLIGGVLAQYTAWPLRLPFVVYLALLAGLAVQVARTRETVDQPVRDLAAVSLRPRVGVPPAIRARFVAPAATAFATLALFGFYYALVPSILADSLDQSNHAVGGAVVFELAAVAAFTTVASRHLADRTAMLAGLVLLLPSLALLVAAQAAGSMGLLLLATTVGGVSGALGYRGSLQVVNEIAPGDRRAEVVSAYFVVCFFANAVPVIGVGVLTTAWGSMRADAVFAGTIALFALAALAAGWRDRR